MHPASAGAAIAGAKVALDVDANDAAVVSVDDVERLVAALASSARADHSAARSATTPSARTDDLLRHDSTSSRRSGRRLATQRVSRVAWTPRGGENLVDERVRDARTEATTRRTDDDEKDRNVTDSKDRSDDEKDRSVTDSKDRSRLEKDRSVADSEGPPRD